MQTILIAAYAVNPYKGSEDGMGWNIVNQLAKHNKVIVITRENNEPNIDKYMVENPQAHYANMQFTYFDLPYWMRFWKKGGRGSQLYYLLWQLGLVFFVKNKGFKFDIAHHLNFHCDWLPSFMWVFNKPFVWGPVGHHPKIPKQFVLKHYGFKAYITDRIKWTIKNYFWKISPFFKKTINQANVVIGMNSSVNKQLKVNSSKVQLIPSVASEKVKIQPSQTKNVFNILSVGRFEPIKGFDVTINAFAKFYHLLSNEEQEKAKLTLVGKGAFKQMLVDLAKENNCENAIDFIEWMPREELQSLYSNAKLFFFPSHEGAGMVVSEAMSYGLPVLCFDNCGPGEFISEDSGIKVPYRNYDETINDFSQQLMYLYKNQKELTQLSKGAKALHEQTLTWETKGEKITAIYKKLKAA